MDANGGVILLGLGAGLLVVVALVLARFGRTIARLLLTVAGVVVVLALAFVAVSSSVGNVTTANTAKLATVSSAGGTANTLCLGLFLGLGIAGLGLGLAVGGGGILYAKMRVRDAAELPRRTTDRRALTEPSPQVTWTVQEPQSLASFDPGQWGW